MPILGERIVYLGIDPGASGGIVSIYGSTVTATKMPPTEQDVWTLVSSHSQPFGDRAFAVIEWIHPAIQGIGKSSMSKLYGSYMQLRGYLTAARIPFEAVQTTIWAKTFGMARKGEESRKWKNRLRAKAQQLFPKVDVTLETADALLISEHCRRYRTGKI